MTTPKNRAHSLLQLSPEELAQLDHATLYSARAHLPQQFQDVIAPYEHQAFAREATRENPLMALPIAAGSLAWPIYKTLVSPGRSAPSANQLYQGLLGVGEGLAPQWNRLAGLLSR